MQNKLFCAIKKYVNSKPIRFHMPGHNGKNIKINTSFDTTELSFCDNLIESNSVIANVESNIANIYNTKYALMLTSGATTGIAIALHTAKNFGNKLLLVANQHKSVHNYANLFGFSITCVQDINDVNLNDYTAVVINSPNYFGSFTIDMQKLKETTALVILDASHYSHYVFSNQLPKLETNIADITVFSFHKTLPVLTGGAGVVCNRKDIYQLLCYSRSILHTSSPSYLTMTSIDNALCNYYQNGNALYAKVIKEILAVKSKLNDNYSYVKTDDVTRLCISTKDKSAKAVLERLEEQNIFLEMACGNMLVAIVTPYNYKHLNKLVHTLNKIEIVEQCEQIFDKNLSKIDINCKNIEFLNLSDSVGRIAASCIGVYPPGTPLITTGDLLDEEIIAFLKGTKHEIFGLVSGKIPVYK